MTTVTIQYFGMDGSGRTVTEAKRDAGSKIEKALHGYYTPTMLRAADLIGIIWREPAGYSYKIIRPDSESGQMFGSSGCDWDEKQAVSACARHMAQNIGSYAGLEKYIGRDGMRELDGYFAWQERFRKARDAGHDDQTARMYADQNTMCV